MSMVMRAPFVQLFRDVPAVRNESCRVKYGSQLGADSAYPTDHPGLAHVGPHFLNVIVCLKLLHFWHHPA